MKQQASFDYFSLPFYLKFSNWLSWYAITGRLKKGNWLDIMCGFNAILQVSQRKNKQITEFIAIDKELDPTLKKFGIITKQHFIKNTLPFKTNTFNNITYINGLEHMWKPQKLINECYRILRPGGILQIIVPTWFGKGVLEFLAFKLKIQPQIFESMNDHKMYYDEKTIWPMFIQAGFQPKDISLRRIKFFFSLHSIVKKHQK